MTLVILKFGENEKLFNSAIIFAPAFAGPRHETKKYPWWREEARPAHIKEITKAKFIDVLVFAYEDDDFNRPEELKFLYPKLYIKLNLFLKLYQLVIFYFYLHIELYF